MKKIGFFLCIFLSLFFTTGCWDRYELNEISIITGMAIDKGETHKYKLTVEALNPVSLNPMIGGGDDTASVTFEIEGNSIAELHDKINKGYTRRTLLSHMRLVVISEEFGREGMLEFLDFMERNREIRNDFNIVLAEGSPASEVLKITYHLQKVSTLKLFRQLQTMDEEWGGIPDVRLKDMIRALTSPGREPVMTTVRIKGSPEKGNDAQNIRKVDPDAIVVLDGISIFKEFNYLGGLSLNDARNYMWLNNQLDKTTLTIPCENEKITTIRIVDTRTKVEAKYKEGIPHFVVKVENKAQMQAYQCKEDYTKPEIYNKYNIAFSRAIEKELKKTIQTVQEKYKVDIFGFGEHMERQDYQNFKKVKDQWNEEFAKAEVEVQVMTRIRRSGLTTKSFLGEL
ncbi:Ger(x)C family spore germination protein [Caldalkalibacillus mannanilyticus]|uniref:Ger(x)C family spore germination protein n=1 Tax=Caldalkalibacillus mannanilyticus TaxID=1418 RepID=UPI00046AC53F|nr:Ger(x)C family spore germination protein [Caldalkalibacillus mannanilyticus]